MAATSVIRSHLLLAPVRPLTKKKRGPEPTFPRTGGWSNDDRTDPVYRPFSVSSRRLRATGDPASSSSATKLAAMGPRRWQVVALGVALCFAAGVVGWIIGRPSDPSFNDVDVGFLSDMQTHHGGAVGLGFAYLPNQHDPLVSHFAREIIVGQSQEISTMNSYLDQAGGEDNPKVNDDIAIDWMGEPVPKDKMPGMPSAAEVDRLKAATGVEADDVFTELMIKHHAGGVAMADYAV